ncbi:MAG: histone deacetylase [Candidatus Nezhaarchaeota archaeon]|nr:histone deacetylase [Candidatus Nezhaarchaeota archaeon]
MTTAIVYSPAYLEHRPRGYHPESPTRLEEILRALRGFGLINRGRCELVEPYSASLDDLYLVHSPTYVERVKRLVASGANYLDGDTYLSPSSFEVASLALAGALKACDLVLGGAYSNAYALVRPPGHHAGTYGRALTAPSQGFCIFNNVAAAAAHLLRRRGLRKVVIIDIDCHHGNGTQDIFYESSQVLYVSLHQDPRTIYPGTGFVDEVGVGEGYGFNVNLPMPPMSGDDVYLRVWDEVVEPIVSQFKPDFVLMSVGYDAHYDDPVTMMNLSSRGYAELFTRALGLASKHCAGRFVACLEGGYGPYLGESAAATIAAMAGSSIPLPPSLTSSSERVARGVEDVVARLKQLLRDRWRL